MNPNEKEVLKDTETLKYWKKLFEFAYDKKPNSQEQLDFLLKGRKKNE